jgi:hypothetical protein
MPTRSDSLGNPDPFSWPLIFRHAQPGNRTQKLRASPSGILASYSNKVSRERSFWAELVVAKGCGACMVGDWRNFCSTLFQKAGPAQRWRSRFRRFASIC